MFEKLKTYLRRDARPADYFVAAIALAVMLLLILVLSGCGKQTPEDKVASQLKTQHALTADERQAAEINAKQYFEKQWAPAGGQRGQFNSCRPSDSNANGLVSCFGFVPQSGGGFAEKKMYCGYRPELVGCSDEDTVK